MSVTSRRRSANLKSGPNCKISGSNRYVTRAVIQTGELPAESHLDQLPRPTRAAGARVVLWQPPWRPPRPGPGRCASGGHSVAHHHDSHDDHATVMLLP